jgi:arabinan endo-1,5-alpha-L-arabinosidase
MNWSSVPVAWRTEDNTSVTCETAFNQNATKTVTIGGATVDFGNFDVEAFSAGGSTYDISGNLWAPDVIYNKKMNKWCMYLSINGDNANCSIVLLTSDKISGPYLYQGPVVFSGFFNTSNAAISYKKTDLELVLGDQASLPSRYAVGTTSGWRQRWPNAIDPCVFYDEEGKLWMSYGSWHGGIWMLELDENTGLRDYDVDYTYTQGSSADDVRVDPYFGTKIAGGRHVSGEASYIKYIDGYYYLFVTYGGLNSDAGYQMRVFRSTSPDGPYEDPYHSAGVAIYDEYRMNYGPDGTRKTDRGENIFGAYGDWGYMATGNDSERSQGHNSVITNGDQTFMVYHTRFQGRAITEAHEVRVHQVFVNADGWLCAAPFEYTGETVTNSDIKTAQQIATANISGNYKVMLHTLNLDHANKELTTPVDIELKSDGSITGDMTGSWSITAGTSYISITVGGKTYNGVMVEQTLEPTTQKVAAFTAMAKSNGNTLWGYKAPASQTIGAIAKGWGDAGCFVGPYTLKSNQAVTFTFSVDATKGVNSYEGYVGIITKTNVIDWGENQYAFIRSMCDYAVGGVWNTGATYNVNNYSGADDAALEAAKITHLLGAMVTMKMERHGQEVLVTTDITKSGTTYRHYYVQDFGTTADVYAFLAADAAVLTVSSVETTTTEAYPAITGTLHGLENNTGGFGGGSHTDMTLAPGKSLSLNFKNYTNGLQAWYNWILEIQKGTKYLDLRADNYGWGDYYNAANLTLENYIDWAIFKQNMNGADIEIVISRETSNTLSIVAKQTLTNGSVVTERYSVTNSDFASGDVTVRLLTEGAHLDLISTETGASAAISELTNTNFTNNTNEYFNLTGQCVAQPTKGLYIVNGKKVIVK